MNRQSSSYLLGLVAFLTLVMIVVLPVLARGFSSDDRDKTAESARRSPQMMVLDRQRSAMAQVEGGVYYRGTTLQEAADAAAWCSENGWACDASMAENAAPAHRLRVSTFWMEVTEVTYRQYAAFLNTLGPGGHASGCGEHLCVVTQAEDPTASIALIGGSYTTTNPAVDDYPVVDVTWYGARAYCESLGRRLPTEGEWEYAARGPEGTLYPWGNEWRYEAANVRGSNSNEDGVIIAEAQPVGDHVDYASPDGIRDLAGNVAEWVADWYAADRFVYRDASVENDAGPAEGTERVVRGGSWDDPPFFARSVQRDHLPPDQTSNTVGFRCVADD